MILRASQVQYSGWYWWRSDAGQRWRIEYFDVVNRRMQLTVMGGDYIGPLQPPLEGE